MMCYRQAEGSKRRLPPIRLVAPQKCGLGPSVPEAPRTSEGAGPWGDDRMAALDESDLRLILGDKYDAIAAAQKLADSKPKPLMVFLKKIFSK